MNTGDGNALLTICISALVFFSLGGLTGWLVSLLRAPAAPKAKAQSAPKPPETTAPPTTAPDPAHIELARIFQRREDNHIFVEANGRTLHTPADVHSAERSWLVLAAEAIYRLLGQAAPRGEPVAPPPEPLPPIDWQPSPPANIQKPSMSPADILVRAVQAGMPRLDQPKSLVEQIDAVLQEMLAQSPLPAGKIHLSENDNLGLEVHVGKQRYDGLEAVPDEAVRQVIRAAIAEWQRRAQTK